MGGTTHLEPKMEASPHRRGGPPRQRCRYDPTPGNVVLDALTDVAANSPWTYAAVLTVALLDAIIPAVPSETTLIAPAALAGTGRLDLWLVLAAAAAGAFLGDNAVYAA